MGETLDFQALLPEPLEITASDGSKWKASPELMGDEAMYFIRNRASLEGMEAAERSIAVFLRCLRVHHPTLTEEEMLRAFTLPQIITAVMRFLARAGRVAFGGQARITIPKKQRVKRR